MTLIKVFEDLWIGDLNACSRGVATAGHSLLTQPHATVHACKDPCHRQAVGYLKNLERTDPAYLSKEVGVDLYLNMIDPPAPLFQLQTFWTAHRFIDLWRPKLPVVIHCNLGNSRAPALAMTYLASVGLIGNNYEGAESWLIGEYPQYCFGKGIETFMKEHWEEIIHAGLPTQTTAQAEGATDEHVPHEDAPHAAQDQGNASLPKE